ncbi:hypothetical protein XSR1_40090 [Xenorhabdus szentirmaii DSM 16338]|uniref:Uncharacterized protein n=1 Tax=Xenorhabdus szentirmaii DSM 16338 TaxID=1427518 RepID=W1IZZ9_9GAMM|nr:hypothetical protein XSR1_40090 [Xenorhabdus szentirmaii DSM 16338]
MLGFFISEIHEAHVLISFINKVMRGPHSRFSYTNAFSNINVRRNSEKWLETP